MSEIILIFGKRGSGKTTLNKRLLQYKARLLIFDPLQEHTDGKIFYSLSSTVSYIKKKCNSLFRVIYRPRDGNIKTNFNLFCKIAYSLQDITVGFEEIDIATQSNYCPQILEDIICYGRHKGISLYAATRRPTEIPKLLTSQANKIFSFKQHEPSDIKYFKNFIGNDIEKAKALGKYEYLEFDLDKQETHKARLKLWTALNEKKQKTKV